MKDLSSAEMRLLRNAWKQRPITMPDQETQLFPLDCDADWIPPIFWRWCLWHDPYIGFWPYQVRMFDFEFMCWHTRADGCLKQARQTGKTTMTPKFLGFMIWEYRVQVVLASTRIDKNYKASRPLISIMVRHNEALLCKSVTETRYARDNAGFKCVSGRDDANKESETAHIVVVDESQDINYRPVYGEISPFRDGVDGIMLCMGIGGDQASMMESVWDLPDTEHLNLTGDEVVIERPRYRKVLDRAQKSMLPFEVDANYYGKRISTKGSALIPSLPEWKDVFPNVSFHPDRLDAGSISINFDFGQTIDASCALALGWYGDTVVIFGYDYHAPGTTVTEQLHGLSRFVVDCPFDKLNPEVNNQGRIMVALLKEAIESRLKEIAEERDEEYIPMPDRAWNPKWASAENIHRACQQIYAKSISGELVYVDDPNNQHVRRCIADLKEIKVRYSAAKSGERRISHTHSDWGAALRTAFMPEKVARLVVAA